MATKRKKATEPKQSQPEAESSTPEHPQGEYARFLHLHALAASRENHQESLDVQQEYERLLFKYGRYNVEGVFVGPPDSTLVPKSFPIANTDCKPIPGCEPLICPRAKPKPPPELLPEIERRFRELQLVGRGQTILWVGRQAEMETLCMWDRGCDCFGVKPANPGRRVDLRGRNEGPIVLGREKRELTVPQYNVVKALLDAGEAGLTKDLLVSKSGHADARGILVRLAKRDADWESVIHFARQPAGGYRIS
jgi:hypothetical protein